MNKVIGSFKAIINNKVTGFSGCKTVNCPNSYNCLRKDPELTLLTEFKCDRDNNGFIPIDFKPSSENKIILKNYFRSLIRGVDDHGLTKLNN